MQKLRSIQVLRGVAATAVVVHHAYRVVDPNSFARVGACGVDLFFVISGFIMARIGRDRTPAGFLRDRVWRIFPMWWIAVIPWLLIKHHALPNVLASVLLWPIYSNGFYLPALHVGWSLCFELLFYGAFAIGLMTRPTLPLAGFGVFLCLGSIFPGNMLFEFAGSPIVVEFLLGVLIAQLPPVRLIGGLTLAAGIIALIVVPVSYSEFIFGHEALIRVALWGLPAASILYGARSLETRFAAEAFDVPVLLGDASYSIYLFHPLAIELLHIDWLMLIPISLGGGIAVHLLIEKPLLQLRGRAGWRRSPNDRAEAIGLG